MGRKEGEEGGRKMGRKKRRKEKGKGREGEGQGGVLVCLDREFNYYRHHIHQR